MAQAQFLVNAIVDTFANRPAATAVPLGTLFWALNTSVGYIALPVTTLGQASQAWQQFSLLSGGALSLEKGDSTATPGNAVLNTPSGRSAFLNGNDDVTITNSLVEAGDTVLVSFRTPLDAAWDDEGWYCTTANGSFTVKVNTVGGLGTNLQFDWVLVKAA